MSVLAEVILAALAVSYVGLFVAGMYLTVAFRSAIRSRHPEAWVRLGQPHVFRDANVLIRFLWNDDYRMLCDLALDRQASSLKVVQVTFILLFFAMAGAVAVRGG